MDTMTKSQRSHVMRRNTGDNLKPERTMLSALKRAGLRQGASGPGDMGTFFVRNPKLFYKRRGRLRTCRPDFLLVWPNGGLALFVHGCFWHCCPKHHKAVDGGRHEGWKQKFRNNVLRDRAVIRAMRAQGFSTMVVWEHDLKDASAADAAAKRLIGRLTKHKAPLS